MLGERLKGKEYYAKSLSGIILLNKWRSNLFWIEPTNKGFIYINGRWYQGRMLIVLEEKGLTAIN
jgi:stage II sporulation protein D